MHGLLTCAGLVLVDGAPKHDVEQAGNGPFDGGQGVGCGGRDVVLDKRLKMCYQGKERRASHRNRRRRAGVQQDYHVGEDVFHVDVSFKWA